MNKVICAFFLSSALIFGQSNRTSEVRIDGVVDSLEYNSMVSLVPDTLTMYYNVDSLRIYIALKSSVPGWLAIGFDPEKGMKNADMIVLYQEKDGNWILKDEYSRGIYGPHMEDEKIGGKNDIENFKVEVFNHYKVVEFVRKLSTGDKYDRVLIPGRKVKVIFAAAKSSDIRKKHDLLKGMKEITLE
ncbi:MAG: DOMON domain-containing protein [Candidatus Hydrothermia bacterium]